MIFDKLRKPKERIELANGNAKINIKSGSAIDKQIKMIALTLDDLRIINILQPYVMENIDEIVEQFYENLTNEPSLLKIINNNSTIDRLKQTLTQHISEMFDGIIDQSYIQKANPHCSCSCENRASNQVVYVCFSGLVTFSIYHY